MNIIDAHLHFSNLETFKRTAREVSFVDYSSAGLKAEFQKSNVIAGIGMGLEEASQGGFPDSNSENPMGLDLEDEIPDFLYYCVGINPIKISGIHGEKELQRIEAALRSERVVGIKVYAGYYHYHVYDPVYEPVYELAAAHKLPVVLHCGDTFSERGLLKYSHPLNVDELAVTHRNINFVMSHFGDPWVVDAGEVILKNWNVYADLSGLLVGDAAVLGKYKNLPLYTDNIKRGLLYANDYHRILFGTDWPLAPIAPYIDFVKALIPEEAYEDVFCTNALRVFGKISLDIGAKISQEKLV